MPEIITNIVARPQREMLVNPVRQGEYAEPRRIVLPESRVSENKEDVRSFQEAIRTNPVIQQARAKDDTDFRDAISRNDRVNSLKKDKFEMGQGGDINPFDNINKGIAVLYGANAMGNPLAYANYSVQKSELDPSVKNAFMMAETFESMNANPYFMPHMFMQRVAAPMYEANQQKMRQAEQANRFEAVR